MTNSAKHKPTRFKVNLGPKGSLPPKKQRNPRKPNLKSAFEKFTENYYNGNETEAKEVLTLYHNCGNEKIQESILTVQICHKSLSIRLAKKLFNIGSHKYNRIKDGRYKKKPGGYKPNFVSIIILLHFMFIKYGNILFNNSFVDDC